MTETEIRRTTLHLDCLFGLNLCAGQPCHDFHYAFVPIGASGDFIAAIINASGCAKRHIDSFCIYSQNKTEIVRIKRP